MKSVLLFFFMLPVLYSFAQSTDESAIRQTLGEQVQAWNEGNIGRFMKTYWENDSLMFIGKGGITYGWQNTLNNYKKNYPDTIAMGKLSYNILKISRLSPEYFYVVGKFHLQRSIGDLNGHYDLLFRKINGRWVIIADHSS
jgi:ketosteroid isomerase-like protein